MKNTKKIAIIFIVLVFLGCAPKKRLYDLTIVSSRNVPLGQASIELKKIPDRVEGRSEKEDLNLKEAIDQALNLYPGSVALSDVVVYRKGERIIVEGFPLYYDEGAGVPKKVVNKKDANRFENTSIQLGVELFADNGIYFSIISDSTVEVVRIPDDVLNKMQRNWQKIEKVNIPAEVEYRGLVYKVVKIETGAFKGFSDLRSITLPNTIESIGTEAFKNCRRLASIAIPEKVSVIEYGTFANCQQLSSVTLPAGLKSIGEHAFSSCWKLKHIDIPQSTQVAKDAFSGSGVKY